MPALVIPFVVEVRPFLGSGVLQTFDCISPVLALRMLAVAGRNQVFLGNLAEILRDRMQQVIDVSRRGKRLAVEAQFQTGRRVVAGRRDGIARGAIAARLRFRFSWFIRQQFRKLRL